MDAKNGGKSGIPRKMDFNLPPQTAIVSSGAGVGGGMTQGQYRAAASQATVATIPEEPGAYLPMTASRKGSMIPLATSSPSGTVTGGAAATAHAMHLNGNNH